MSLDYYGKYLQNMKLYFLQEEMTNFRWLLFAKVHVVFVVYRRVYNIRSTYFVKLYFHPVHIRGVLLLSLFLVLQVASSGR